MTEPAAPLFELKDFSVTFDTPDGPVRAVKGVSLAIGPGECLGVVGESGSGKTQAFLAAFGLSAGNAKVSGQALFRGVDVLKLNRQGLNKIRGKQVSMIFQDPLTALTPHMTVEAQMGEVLAYHDHITGEAAHNLCAEWLGKVRIAEASRRLAQYPHELSGGMRQRVMIAMAMMTKPDLLIADEPTTALDTTVQAQVLDLLEDLQKETGAAIVLISHDMGVIARLARRACVMRHGEIVETATAEHLFASPREPYTKMLIEATPSLLGARLNEGEAAESATVLSVKDVKVQFPIRVAGGPFGTIKKLRAVDGVSFELRAGETLGIVGESGCGKSTLARAILHFAPKTAGAITYFGATTDPDRKKMRALRRDLQIVFQDPLASLDPRMAIGRSIAEPLLTFRPDVGPAQREAAVREMMGQVGLDPGLINRYPHELSGGQNQRVGIARAMILKPTLVICDEAVSALDVSIQAQIVKLLADLQRDLNIAMVFISHDLAVVREISHRVMVLYLGRVVEEGPADAIYANPRHPYTKALLAAAPIPDPVLARARPRVTLGDLPSPLDPRAGLRFLKSKWVNEPEVEPYRPQLLDIGGGHRVAEFDETGV